MYEKRMGRIWKVVVIVNSTYHVSISLEVLTETMRDLS